MSILSHEIIAHDNTKSLLLFLHGFLGSKANWRSIAKSLVADSSIGAVLVDVRMHGQSQRGFLPPHTLMRAADDIVALTSNLTMPVYGVLGHSFGAKLALSFIERYPQKLNQAFIVDALPWAHDSNSASLTYRILSIIDDIAPTNFPSRKDFEECLEKKGVERSTAQWLAMNLDHSDDGLYRLRLKPKALRELLDDYFTCDLTHVLTRAETDIHFVVGSKSEVVTEKDRQRLNEIASTNKSHLHIHCVEGAGHYVHVDAPEEIIRLLKKIILRRQ